MKRKERLAREAGKARRCPVPRLLTNLSISLADPTSRRKPTKFPMGPGSRGRNAHAGLCFWQRRCVTVLALCVLRGLAFAGGVLLGLKSRGATRARRRGGFYPVARAGISYCGTSLVDYVGRIGSSLAWL